MHRKQSFMEDIWQQFHRLPKIIRDAVATPAALECLSRLETSNPGLDLAAFVMRVMVKEFPVGELPRRLVADSGLTEETAAHIVDELTQAIFLPVSEYLGLPKPSAAPVATPTAPSPQPIAEPPRDSDLPAIPKAAISVPPPAQLPITPQAPLGPMAPPPTLSIDDDTEIAAHAARLKSISGSAGPTDFDTMSEAILARHRLAFPDELLTKRAISVLKARLKGIRSADETVAMLLRPIKVGGLNLDPDLAQAIGDSLEQAASQITSRGMVQPPAPPAPAPPPRVPPPEEQQPVVAPPLSRDFRTMKPDPTPVSQPRPIPAPRIVRPADIPPPPPLQPEIKSTPPPKVVSVAVNAPPSPAVQRPRSTDRPAVADVTAPVSTLGPAEEMRSFTLVQFRRLGQGAAESAKKILDMFRHLQEESFSLWSEALAGWRQSEVYRIYLDMGRQSLDQNLSIDQVIQRRASSGLPYLSEHEFNVLADMNRRLQV